MPHIELLDEVTIDKIAAGEVVERPASVVKELVENAIDSGATAVTVEIEDGGIALIRVADNGCGIPREEVRTAFLRHSTSKIRKIEDLNTISTLGFRGEALSSISAVAKVEMITRTREEETGTRYLIEGGKELGIEDTGAREGTTFLVRQLFYNTPARRKFLKTAMTEASHVNDLMMRLMLSHPEISFQFISHRQQKLFTSGNGKLKDVIYQIYGRDIAGNLLPLSREKRGVRLEGYLGKPVISRGNRNFENYFVNGRYVKNQIVARAIEDAYRDYTMQHKYPFVAFHILLDQEKTDVNVHPAKMEVRFGNQQEIYDILYQGIREGLQEKELIQEVTLDREAARTFAEEPAREEKTEKTEKTPGKEEQAEEPGKKPEQNLDYFMDKMRERVQAYHQQHSRAEVTEKNQIFRETEQRDRIREAAQYAAKNRAHSLNEEIKTERTLQKEEHALFLKPENREKPVEKEESIPHCPQSSPQTRQLDLFEENILKKEVRQDYTLIGQVFETYWLVEYQDCLYIIDQHAAHERVLYERTLKSMKNREYTSQYLSPPIILTLTMQEAQVLKENRERFASIGFEIEPFGGNEYAVRAVPDNLFGIAKKELLLEMLDSLADGISAAVEPSLIDEKIASMSCKAAVKGNSRLSAAEVDALIGELLTLENPYHCPHGRPTIISMTKRELEKKFKRIV
ncbi:MAG TPA: DNA mismatch repair endonuclease MutL [Candidatus Bariatricus faecipullorum]|nr:DNA mismatch repair endonuclease MutL [Candidatus Bariatricus faecipullorum]